MDDMSELIKQFSSMIEKDGIPDNLKDIVGNLNSSKNEQASESDSSPFGGIDMGTILKMKGLMDGVNSKDDPRANLLRSLKPYMKESRKSKVDQYVQLLSMSKIFDVMKNTEGDKK